MLSYILRTHEIFNFANLVHLPFMKKTMQTPIFFTWHEFDVLYYYAVIILKLMQAYLQ